MIYSGSYKPHMDRTSLSLWPCADAFDPAGRILSIWPKMTNLKSANSIYRLEGRMYMTFFQCLHRLQSLRWTEILLAMTDTELPAKEHCSCLATPASFRGFGEPGSIQRCCCLHLLMSSETNMCLHNFLTLGKAQLEVPLLAVLLHRSPGLSSPGAYAKYVHDQGLASCLCKVLAMIVFHRSWRLLRHLAELKKPKTHWHQGEELKRRSILKVQLSKSDLELF